MIKYLSKILTNKMCVQPDLVLSLVNVFVDLCLLSGI